MSKSPAIICYYLNIFKRFIDYNIDFIEQSDLSTISDKLMVDIIPLLADSEPKYSQKTSTLFEVLGTLV